MLRDTVTICLVSPQYDIEMWGGGVEEGDPLH